MQKVFTPHSDKNMRLVPSAKVSIVYSESPLLTIKKPKLSMSNICVYNQFSDGGVDVAGNAQNEVLTPDQVALMQYVEYRMYAVESS